MKRIYGDLVRLARGSAFLLLSALLCWRALNYATLVVDGTILAPMMCILLSIVLGMTGIIVAIRGGDFDNSPEQTAAGQN